MVTMASAPSNIANATMSSDVSTSTLQKKTSENRRSNKPIMEKRRRARINNSLNELKTLLLDATKKDPARHSKLEKADILEMAVKYVGALQKNSSSASSLTDKYMAGFSECASEVSRFPGIDPIVRRRLEQHLTNFVNSRARSGTVSSTTDLASGQISQQNLHLHILPSENVPVSNQSGILLSAGANSRVQLVPTRLPNGDIALILPSCSANNVQQRLPVSPTPSSSSSSPPPLARIAHSRSASTDSESPIGFERLSVNIPASNSSIEDMMCHSPSSVHSNYSSPHSPDMNTSFNVKYENCGMYSPPLQKPLSLVVREGYVDSNDDKPWRPW